jgi:hypothetical protein
MNSHVYWTKEIEMAAKEMQFVGKYTKYWEKCWDPQACVHIPFDGDKCIGAHACVRIIEDGGTFFIEAELNGNTVRYALADACIPALSIGIATLEVCVTNLNVQNNQLKSLRLQVKGCVGADIGPIHIGQCWDLFGQDIVFSHLSGSQLFGLLGVDGEAHSSATVGQTFVSFVQDNGVSSGGGRCHCNGV